MKKLFLISLMALSLNSMAYVTVSKDRGFWDKVKLKDEMVSRIMNKYNYDTDIAILSDGEDTLSEAKSEAQNGLNSRIEELAYNTLMDELNKTNLTGPGFNDIQMQKFAKQIADTLSKNYQMAGGWIDNTDGKYYALIKVSNKDVETMAKKVFVERLEQIINNLEQLKEGIPVD